MIDLSDNSLFTRLVPFLVLSGLILLAYMVMHPFIIPITWAIILAYATWPLFTRLANYLPGRRTTASLLMTFATAAAFILPFLWLALLIRSELTYAYGELGKVLANGPFELPEFIIDTPVFGPWLQEMLNDITSDPGNFRAQVVSWIEQQASQMLNLLGGVGRNAMKLGFALVSLFFFYRDGERLLIQVQTVLHRFLGTRVDSYLKAIGSMTTAVVWGLIATAVAQGVVAGLGYWWFGLNSPVLLGAITVVVALIPFGTPVAWGTLSIWLLAKGDTFNGIGLLLWGTLVVSWVDNLVRPIVISNASRIPFLLVLFGVLGGLATFGFIGLFVGPVILAVLVAVWNEWLDNNTNDQAMASTPAQPEPPEPPAS